MLRSLKNMLKKEGFIAVEGFYVFIYRSFYNNNFSTKAYILEVLKRFTKSWILETNLIFLLNETPYPAYYYDKETNDFELLEKRK